MTMYKLGFRTVEEVAEADPAELIAIPGMGDEERISGLQRSARETMEVQRMERIRELVGKGTSLTERERMFFISGIGERTIELLLEAGYRKVEDLANEKDMDRLALSTGLGLQKAQTISERAQEFLDSEKEILAKLREEAELIAAASSDEEDDDETLKEELEKDAAASEEDSSQQ